ncbi:MAG: hypothetical protein H0W97_00415 [Actinobacteria bacterium]|nr:hypothetical protein [Actinomycetota bacterium]
MAAGVDVVGAPFESLDFLYVPSGDVSRDLSFFSEVLGGWIVFAIDSMGTRVAAALAELEGRGWQREHTFEIPHGPICSFEGPGGHRVALYQLTRPEVAEHFEGRRDF